MTFGKPDLVKQRGLRSPLRGRRLHAANDSVLPISLSQFDCLARDSDPTCTDATRNRWVLSYAISVKPNVDMRRLQRAINKLFVRHDSLRTRFVDVGPDYGVVIDPPTKIQIKEVDLSSLDDTAFSKRVQDIANAPMPLFGGPLAEMIVVHRGALGDVVIWRAHHAITDGFGMVVLVEDMLRLLIGLPITTRAMTYAEYVARFVKVPTCRAAEIEAFWRDIHRDLPKAPMIGRKAKGLEPLWANLGEVKGKRLRVDVGQKSMTRLIERAQASNHSFVPMMFVGCLEALCQIHETDQLAFTTLIARSDPALSHYCGAHYFDPILTYRACEGAPMTEAIQRLWLDLSLANEHLPTEAAVQSTSYEKELIARGIYPRQFSVHQPRPIGRMKKSMFSSSINASAGVESHLGPYVLSRIDVSKFVRSRTDLRFLLRETDAGTGFDLECDGISFTDDEITRLNMRICALLELDIEGAHWA